MMRISLSTINFKSASVKELDGYMKRRFFTLAKWLLAAVLLFFVLYFLQRILMPKYLDEAFEGRLVAEYYSE